MGSKLEVDLRALVQYYGEDFNATKPEDLFGIVVAFSSALQVRPALALSTRLMFRSPARGARGPGSGQEARHHTASEHELGSDARGTGSGPSRGIQADARRQVPEPLGRKSLGRGGLDDALRDLRSGAGLRRTRATVVSQRPLSRVFLDGTNR